MVDMLGTFAVEAFDAELWRCELDYRSCRGLTGMGRSTLLGRVEVIFHVF